MIKSQEADENENKNGSENQRKRGNMDESKINT